MKKKENKKEIKPELSKDNTIKILIGIIVILIILVVVVIYNYNTGVASSGGDILVQLG